LQQHEYFNSQRPVVLAHRGGTAHTENTLEAFADSIAAGVFSIETDVRTTKDQVAVLFHDEDLIRVAGIEQKISDTNFDELSNIELQGGGKVPSLAQALATLPQARFNLDIKDEASVKTAAQVINSAKSHNRVLVSSFSESRRTATLKLMTASVATSAISSVLLGKLYNFTITRTNAGVVNFYINKKITFTGYKIFVPEKIIVKLIKNSH
jgi:glycerophosphoryl diester phosphodiesterase